MVPLLFCISWLLADTGGVRGVVVSGEALPLWECSMWTASGRVISLRSAVAPAPTCVRGARSLLCWLFHSGVYFVKGVPSATFVCSSKTHLHVIWLYQALLFELFSCLDVLEESHWNKEFATYRSRLRLTFLTTVCHFPSLWVLWA